jgi:mannose-6-phosphate isomerase-like protein (cupin superfamily)
MCDKQKKETIIMSELTEFLASGILEMYVMGYTSLEENVHVERMASLHSEVTSEIHSIESTLVHYAMEYAVEPDPTIKPFLMATIDYMDRIGNGEAPSFPPMLTPDSRVEDFSEWLNRNDLELEEPLNQVQAKIIGYTPQITTAIVWLEHGAPPETHTDELEKFLIVEGTCNIIVDGQDNYLQPGDVFSIPLHLSHTVMVTSAQPCKIILQRIAA